MAHPKPVHPFKQNVTKNVKKHPLEKPPADAVKEEAKKANLPVDLMKRVLAADAKLDLVITKKVIPAGVNVDMGGRYDTAKAERVMAGAWGARGFLTAFLRMNGDKDPSISSEDRMIAAGTKQNYQAVLRDAGVFAPKPSIPDYLEVRYKMETDEQYRNVYEEALFYCDFQAGFNIERLKFIDVYKDKYKIPERLTADWTNFSHEKSTPSPDIEAVLKPMTF